MTKRGSQRIIYQESLLSVVNTVAFTLVTLVLVYAMFLQADASPGGLSYVLLGFMVLAGINFSKLSIMITTGGVIVGFGFFKQALHWSQITACSIDPIPSVGWLIQMSARQGKHQIGYHVFGTPKIKLAVQGTWISQLSFSTRHPDEVLNLLTKGESAKGRSKKR